MLQQSSSFHHFILNDRHRSKTWVASVPRAKTLVLVQAKVSALLYETFPAAQKAVSNGIYTPKHGSCVDSRHLTAAFPINKPS